MTGDALPSGRPARDRWESRSTFILAGIGAAVGLGNIWRFPFLAYRHGGGAFLIPYVIALMTLGLPLLQAELALGRLFQKGDVMSFGSIHKRARGVGAISAVAGFAVVTYYSSIIAWAFYFMFASFEWPFKWSVDCGGGSDAAVLPFETIQTQVDDGTLACENDPSRALPINAARSFFGRILGTDPQSLEDGVARRISGPLLGMLLLTWLVSYFCIWKGVKSVGFAVKLTVILPWTLLGILLIYNATLEGSEDGVREYIGEWDMDVLKDGTAWSDAAGQIFLSLGSTLGIMSAYGSFAPTTTNIYVDNSLIAYINCFTSLMAGFVVFSILGNMAHRSTAEAAGNPNLRQAICAGMDECAEMDCSVCGTDAWETLGACCGDVDTDSVATGGVYLVFAVYPATMSYIGKGGANILSIMWFATLWLLGIDSMFALIEGFATVISDTPRFAHLGREKVALFACIVGFLASIVFVSDIGFALLDVFDHYILNFALMLTGALEAYVVAWVWGWQEIRYRCGFRSAAIFTGAFTFAGFVIAFLCGVLHHEVDENINIAIAVPLGVGIFVIGAAAAFVMRDRQTQSFSEWLEIVSFAGTRNLRSTFAVKPTPAQRMLHVLTFDVPVKYICYPALLSLFVNQAIADDRTNGYEGDYYPNWTHIVGGVLILGTMLLALTIWVVYPGFWDAIKGEGGDEAVDEHTRVKRLVEQRIGDIEDNKGASGVELNSEIFLPEFKQHGDDWGNQGLPPSSTGSADDAKK